MSRPDPSITANLLGALVRSAEGTRELGMTKIQVGKTVRAPMIPMARISSAPRKSAGPGHTRSSNRGK